MDLKLSREKIVSMEQQLINAIISGDTDVLDSLLHDDLLFMVPGGQVITKAMDMASHKSREMVVDKLDYEIESIQLIEDTAIVITTMDTSGKMLGEAIHGKFRYLRVWKLVDQNLQVIAGNCTAITEM